MEPSWLMEPQVAADAGAGGGRWRCDDEDDVELLGLPRPSSVRATPARWQKVVTQLWNPFVLFSLLPPSPPIPRPSGHPSDNDNVAFGIPTDLETVRRTGGPRKERRGEREGGEARATVVSSSKSVRRQAFQLLAGFHGAPVAPRNAAAQISTSALNSLSFCLFACCMLE